MKSYLFIISKPPHSGIYVQETLDIILTTAAFEQAVSLLFLDDGVFNLKNRQNPDTSGLKDTAAIFDALALYDVNALYIESESLQERGLSPDALCLPTEAICRNQLSQFMGQFSVLVPQ